MSDQQESRATRIRQWILGPDDARARYRVRWFSAVFTAIVVSWILTTTIISANERKDCVRGSEAREALAEYFENGGQIALSQKVFHSIPTPGNGSASGRQTDEEISQGCYDAYPPFWGFID